MPIADPYEDPEPVEAVVDDNTPAPAEGLLKADGSAHDAVVPVANNEHHNASHNTHSVPLSTASHDMQKGKKATVLPHKDISAPTEGHPMDSADILKMYHTDGKVDEDEGEDSAHHTHRTHHHHQDDGHYTMRERARRAFSSVPVKLHKMFTM